MSFSGTGISVFAYDVFAQVANTVLRALLEHRSPGS